MKLNLGCGQFIREGFVNIDFRRVKGVDRVLDVSKPLPYDEGSIDMLFSSHIIEHIWWDKIEKVIEDWFRVLKKEGILEIWTVDFDLIVKNLDSDDIYDFFMFQKQLFNIPEVGQRHVSAFNFKFLSKILKKKGFREVTRLVDKDEFPFYPLHEGYNLGVRAIK